ncbi:uncharacterized protein LOC117649639 [Thrips palmi]|uniref:Uncharacterized protein LOC117649639 n=1 Tax=Thrips palmi TaxID=161013 RepID=A0A6P8ZTW6_THRPL|nr:uncharacterized protein LOC117649639 [Thrips palmi]
MWNRFVDSIHPRYECPFRVMECHVCFEEFDCHKHRPKVLPCGHSFCLQCLDRLPVKECPVDAKGFDPTELVDNFILLEPCDKTSHPTVRFWCRSCRQEATSRCVDEHSVCSFRKARAEEAARQMDSLEAAEAAVAGLRAKLEDCCGRLEWDQVALALARGRVRDALEADRGSWEETKRAAAQSSKGLSESAACIANEVMAAVSASLQQLRLVEGGGREQENDLPASDESGAPAHVGAVEAAVAAAASQWEERTNEEERGIALEEMAARMQQGCLVARGRDFDPYWTMDGVPPGPGTVTSRGQGRVDVLWSRTGVTAGHRMGLQGLYELRLQAPPPLKPNVGTDQYHFLDVETIEDVKDKAMLLADASLNKVLTMVGLYCSDSPAWSQRVLEQVADHLLGLQMVLPQQRHLDVVLAMQLDALCLVEVSGDQPLQKPNVGTDQYHFLDVETIEDVKDKAMLLADASLNKVLTMVGLYCSDSPAWSQRVLEQVADHLLGLQMVLPQQRHLDVVLAMQLDALCLVEVSGDQPLQVSRMASLRFLELHCSLEASLPVLSFPRAAAPAGLLWLRCAASTSKAFYIPFQIVVSQNAFGISYKDTQYYDSVPFTFEPIKFISINIPD